MSDSQDDKVAAIAAFVEMVRANPDIMIWTRRIDDEGHAWRWEGEKRGWVRTPERDLPR